MKTGAMPDQAARFLGLLKPIEGELEAYCRRLVWDAQEVRDALHNALARAIGAFDRYHDGTNFRAWMYKIVTNEAFAQNRKHQRLAMRECRMEPEEIALLPEEPADGRRPEGSGERIGDWQEWLDEGLVRALRTLAQEERAVLLLRAMGGLKYLEIAEALDMPVGSVMGYLARARKKMKLALTGKHNSQSMGRPL